MAPPRARRRSILDFLDSNASFWGGTRLPDPSRYDGKMLTVVRVADGAVRDLMPDKITGILNADDALLFAAGGTLDVWRIHDLLGSGTFFNFNAGQRPRLVSNGVMNTVGGVPIIVSTGASRGLLSAALSWSYPMIVNVVAAMTTAASARGAYLAGADASQSGYRDIQLSVRQNWTLALGEDMASMQPNTSSVAANTASIITGIRTAYPGAVKGYLIQNDVITSTFTSEQQTTSIQPNGVWLFGDPDSVDSFCPAGWGIQELVLFNGAAPPTGDALSALHASQSEFFGIPIRQTLAWPIDVTRNLLTSSGSPLATSGALKISYNR